MTPRPVAVVDPYSAGALLARALAARGRPCVAVQSTERPPPLYRPFDRGLFASVVAAGPVEQTADVLRRLGVEAVLAGCEAGVEAADELSERLGLVSNGTRLSGARRDKALMAQAVAARGVATPAQLASSRPDELVAWAGARNLWPVVVKPARSGGSDGVTVCRSEREVERACRTLLGRRNALGEVNDAALVQELLRGTEYVVDTVGSGGGHRPVAFWRYHRPARANGSASYDAMELLPHAGPRQAALLTAAESVLDALGIAHGPAHVELVWVPGRGPVLIEAGARLNGGDNALLGRLCGRPDAAALTVAAYLEPARFLERAAEPVRPPRHAVNRFLVPPRGRRVQAGAPLDALRRLPSCRRLSARPGRAPSPGGAVGVVTLIHRDRDVIERDLAEIRRLERDGLYGAASERTGAAAP